MFEDVILVSIILVSWCCCLCCYSFYCYECQYCCIDIASIRPLSVLLSLSLTQQHNNNNNCYKHVDALLLEKVLSVTITLLKYSFNNNIKNCCSMYILTHNKDCSIILFFFSLFLISTQ
jgi:hypothetical protein